METFTEFRPLVVDPHYQDRKRRCINELNIDELDAPISGLIEGLNDFSFCFTMQSCFGHFLYEGQENANNIEPLPHTDPIQAVEYRIAYVAFCIENSSSGKEFLGWLKPIAEIDPTFIQFGCAEWFWERSPNSYVLQVEPERHMLKDTCTIDYQEACNVEMVRNQFYDHLMMLVSTIHRP